MAGPIPQTTPIPIVVSRLIWAALGPTPARRPQIVAEWAGLRGAAPLTLVEVAARHGISEQTLLNWRNQVGAAAPTTLPDQAR